MKQGPFNSSFDQTAFLPAHAIDTASGPSVPAKPKRTSGLANHGCMFPQASISLLQASWLISLLQKWLLRTHPDPRSTVSMGLLYRNGKLQDSSLGGETEHTWGLGSGHPPNAVSAL
jgi:hypothetical protein